MVPARAFAGRNRLNCALSPPSAADYAPAPYRVQTSALVGRAGEQRGREAQKQEAIREDQRTDDVIYQARARDRAP